MQEIREEMMKQWGGNWQEMTNDERRKMRQQMKDTWQEMGVDERRQMKKQIKEAMRQMPFPGHRGMPFGRHRQDEGWQAWAPKDFFDPFSRQDHKPNPTSTSKDETAEDDWQDF